MRSEVFDRILANTYRKVTHNVDAYFELLKTGVKKRFHYYFDLKSFNIGFGFCRTTGISGWKYMLSFDLGFFCCWIYFVNIEHDKYRDNIKYLYDQEKRDIEKFVEFAEEVKNDKIFHTLNGKGQFDQDKL